MKRWMSRLTSLALSVVFITPLLILVFTGISVGSEHVSLNFGRVPTDPLITTLLLAFSVSIISIVIAVAMVVSLMQLRSPFRKMGLFLIGLPLLFPPFIGAIAYVDIFKSPFGLRLMGSTAEVEFLQAVFVLSLFLYPYCALPLYARLRMMRKAHKRLLAIYAPSLLSYIQLLFLPHTKMVLLSGSTLVFLYVLADFGAVSMLRMHTLTTSVYESITYRTDTLRALYSSLLLITLTLLTLWLSHRSVGGVKRAHVEVAKSDHSGSAGVVGALSLSLILILSVFSVGIPLGKIAWWLYEYVRDDSALKTIWSVSKAPLFSVVLQTLVVSVVATFGCVISAYWFFLLHAKKKKSSTMPVTRLATMIHSIPGIVLVFALIIFKQSLPTLGMLSVGVFFYGYFLRFSGIAFTLLYPQFQLISSETYRIGDIFVSGKLEYIRKIIYPFTRPALLQSISYIFFTSSRELTIPLLLLPLGSDVLSTRIWQTSSVGLYSYSAPAMVMLLLVSSPALIYYVKSQI